MVLEISDVGQNFEGNNEEFVSPLRRISVGFSVGSQDLSPLPSALKACCHFIPIIATGSCKLTWGHIRAAQTGLKHWDLMPDPQVFSPRLDWWILSLYQCSNTTTTW
jgi:hypothetical protein